MSDNHNEIRGCKTCGDEQMRPKPLTDSTEETRG